MTNATCAEMQQNACHQRRDASFPVHLAQMYGQKNILLKSELKKHSDRHTRPYACPITSCNGINFGDKASLLRHQREKHESAKYFCQISSCARNRRGFARKRNLLAHVSSRHEPVSGNAVTASKSPQSTGSMEGRDEGHIGEEDGGSDPLAETGGLRAKLLELEVRKRELLTYQMKVDEDIQTLRNALQLVAAVE